MCFSKLSHPHDESYDIRSKVDPFDSIIFGSSNLSDDEINYVKLSSIHDVIYDVLGMSSDSIKNFALWKENVIDDTIDETRQG